MTIWHWLLIPPIRDPLLVLMMPIAVLMLIDAWRSHAEFAQISHETNHLPEAAETPAYHEVEF